MLGCGLLNVPDVRWGRRRGSPKPFNCLRRAPVAWEVRSYRELATFCPIITGTVPFVSAPVTEWEFTADVASWINEILAKDAGLPFSRAKCEQRGRGSLKRRDLTILDQNGNAVLTGEVKLPFQKDGGSPHNAKLVKDARSKAVKAKAPYFFTWNVNECVLWETDPKGSTWPDQDYKSWDVTSIHEAGHLSHPAVLHEIQTWLPLFLNAFAQIIQGALLIGRKSPDERFIEVLESALRMPIILNLVSLNQLYKRKRFRSELDQWMRDDQGWIIYDDAAGIRDNLERASKFACYALVNKLVFYEALLKRYGARMGKLTIPAHIDTGDDLRKHLEAFFADAKRVTSDYETVFGEQHTSVGNRIPFYADGAVNNWRDLVDQIHKFDFSKLDYEVIGKMCERLISPEERHKYGQFYTRVEIVDLINSFSIQSGDEKVMDPACGGGTFLVRAYARKRELQPGRRHSLTLTDLYGIDVSHFATHLTTINLATRDLINYENYPQIARADFFDVERHKTFLKLPQHVSSKGLGKLQHREIEIPILDAVVGNPPYVRQEDIRQTEKGRKTPKRGTKEYYQQLVKQETGVVLTRRSDLHCYFWLHASSFLRDGGYLCLLTSSQWLDVEYGFGLQRWMLRNFEILAIFESIDEPWFVGARVVTAVTILRRRRDPNVRMDNIVRFVQLRRPMREILDHDGTTAAAVKVADDFRDEILNVTENTVNERYRARLVSQADLWNEGVRLGELIRAVGSEDSSKDELGGVQAGDYYGGKWGVHLRAPDLWFDILDQYGTALTPLADLVEIRRGITSGRDSFFYPKDCSPECLDEEPSAEGFQKAFGVARSVVSAGKVRLVACGKGYEQRRPVESRFLEPEVHSLMEIHGFSVSAADCARLVLLVGKSKKALKGTHVLRYLNWGEKEGVHETSTCSARVSEDREWYDLTGYKRGVLFSAKAQQYKYIVPTNDESLQCNCNLYNLFLPKTLDASVMAGLLNSSFAVLSKLQYGRPVGVEGNLKTEVIDTNMMLVPDPRLAGSKATARVKRAFRKLKKRKALYFLSERRLREMAYLAKGRVAELTTLSDQSELDMSDCVFRGHPDSHSD